MSEQPTSAKYSPWPFRLAVAVALATFPLIWVGGLVTTTKAGMAVPDWPGTYGYNLFLYPWQTWLFGPWDLFIEHGHRLFGAAVGMLAILLVAVTWRCDGRRWLWLASLGGLALVIVQGVLGGARVLLSDPMIAPVHGCVGPLFFAYTCSLAVFTSRFWQSSPPAAADSVGTPLARTAWILAATAYVQLVLGSLVRHVPPSASPGFFRAVVFLHLIAAGVLLIQAVIFHVGALRSGCIAGRAVRWLSLAAVLLILAQVTLGVATWVSKYAWPAELGMFDFAAAHLTVASSFTQSLIVTAHVAGGSLILAVSVIQAWCLSRRFFRLRDADPARTHCLLRAAA